MVGVMVLGVAVGLFPFATPETVGRIGAARSITLVRAIGLLVAGISAAALALRWLPG